MIRPTPDDMSAPYLDEVAGVLERLRSRRPLVHCMTNQVVKNFTANALLAIGAAPAMVEHPGEAAEFAAMADAVLVNLGTLDECQMAAVRASRRCSTRVITPPGVLPPWRSRSSWVLRVALTDSMS